METFKRHLDSLPKIGFDYLESYLKQGDVIYEIIGDSGLFGRIDIFRMVYDESGNLNIFRGALDENTSVKSPYVFSFLKDYMSDSRDRVLTAVNNTCNPFLIEEKEKRELALKKGEKTIRYKLVKKDGKEFEVVT